MANFYIAEVRLRVTGPSHRGYRAQVSCIRLRVKSTWPVHNMFCELHWEGVTSQVKKTPLCDTLLVAKAAQAPANVSSPKQVPDTACSSLQKIKLKITTIGIYDNNSMDLPKNSTILGWRTLPGHGGSIHDSNKTLCSGGLNCAGPMHTEDRLTSEICCAGHVVGGHPHGTI